MTKTNKALILSTTAVILAGVGTIVTTVLDDCETTEPVLDASTSADADVSDIVDGSVGGPPPGTGMVTVKLFPSSTGDHWVSFGFPLPPGALDSSTMLRVFGPDGVEIPAFVKSLGEWRSIPTSELLCDGLEPSSEGYRSVLIQFPRSFSSTAEDTVSILLGEQGQRLSEGVPVQSTVRIVNDGRLYFGTENVVEPVVLAAIDNKWLSCTGLNTLSGLSDQHTELAKTDRAQKDFFYTSIKDYRSGYDQPPGSWPVNVDYAHVDLYAAEDGTWLYQRPQHFYNLYMRTGMVDALREAYHAASHYRNLLYTEPECVAAGAPAQWCRGFFRVKNPNIMQYYKDIKYSYGEDISTLYWLTGDDSLLSYLGWISAATKTQSTHTRMDTERFTSVALAAPVYEYEVTGNEDALAYARQIVDFLFSIQNAPNSEGNVTGCFPGNDEWGVEGFSPWMTPLMMHSLLRYYFVSQDDRVPGMLAASAKCLVDRGMAWTSQIQNTNMLIPFYGGINSGVPHDADGDNPWVGVEHAGNVAQGVAIGLLYTTDPVKREELKTAVINLVRSSEWAYAYWTRTTAGLPKFRLAPWRKYNWWWKNVGAIQWVLFGKPDM